MNPVLPPLGGRSGPGGKAADLRAAKTGRQVAAGCGREAEVEPEALRPHKLWRVALGLEDKRWVKMLEFSHLVEARPTLRGHCQFQW